MTEKNGLKLLAPLMTLLGSKLERLSIASVFSQV
jgi:hypothetical protein